MNNRPIREPGLSACYKNIGTVLSDLYSLQQVQGASANRQGKTKLDVSIDMIKQCEKSTGTTFHIPEFTKLLLLNLDPDFHASVPWGLFDRDFGTLTAAAQKKINDLSTFLRDNFMNAKPPLPVVYETLVNPSAPDVNWGFVTDDNANQTAIKVVYFCIFEPCPPEGAGI